MFDQILPRFAAKQKWCERELAILAVAMLLFTVLWSRPSAAQDAPPLIAPSEHKLPVKKDLGPRAIGILQLTNKGKASLVPIAIMIDGKFWDATAYKADPVPMALEYGTIYEAERTGSSQGLFTVGSALRSNSVNSQAPWLGTGAWVPAGAEETKKDTVMKASGAAPVGLNDTDAPPRLTRDPGAANPNPQTPSGSPSPSTSSPSSSSPSTSNSGGSGNSGDEPPRLSKPASEPNSAPNSTSGDAKPSTGGQSGSAQAGSAQTGSASPNPASGNPNTASSKSDSPKTNSGNNVPVDDSGADASNRPRLRRGKPAESFADEDVPGYSKPGVTPSATAVSAKAPSAPEPVEKLPAISDAHGPDPHSYGFQWLKGEESQRHDQMLAFAKQQLAAYLKTEAKEQITPQTHSSHALQRTTAKKAPEPVLENAKMVAYDLWLTNLPVLIFTAEAHMPPSASGSSTSEASTASSPGGPYSDLTYSITIAAYPDTYNNLHKLYVGITDKYHLDVTPKLELIDAVDADGDGRGELLFRETSDAGSGWVIYRATADSLWKMYDSLNPQ